jgi:hypothetical protein
MSVHLPVLQYLQLLLPWLMERLPETTESILGGSADTKPGASAFSYLKGNAYGQVTSSGAPAAGPAMQR